MSDTPADTTEESTTAEAEARIDGAGERRGRRGTVNVVLGHAGNNVTDGVVGATVGGGGRRDAGAGDDANAVTDNYGTVAGGRNNRAGDDDADYTDASYATVGGGRDNAASAEDATVGGGAGNVASSPAATVGGGDANDASGYRATVAGGDGNSARGGRSTVCGGVDNAAAGSSAFVGGGLNNGARESATTVGGGQNNTASGDGATVGGGAGNDASGYRATVAGGDANEASGHGATVPGGRDNRATGAYSLAAGRGARANGDGAFVWGDSSSHAVTANRTDAFTVQAGGGAVVYSRSDRDTGVVLRKGSGSWSSISTRTVKTNVSPVDTGAVLDGVESLDVSRWEYDTAEDAPHMGPMAEDFHEAFGLGADDEHIATVDATGVAFAAIQGLAERLGDARTELDEKDDRIEELEDRLTAVESRLRTAGTPADD